MRIENKVAVVTGGAVGIGRAIAVALAEEGAQVVVADVDEAGGVVTTELAPAGRCTFRRVDMTVAEEIGALIADTQPQILINCAGGGGHIPPHFPHAPPAQWERAISLNLLGPLRATQAALPLMHQAGGGAVVNIASTAGLGLAPYQSPEYAAAKAGLIRFTSTLDDLGDVRMNCLVPDWVATERVTAAELATDPPPIPMPTVVAATVRLVRDESLAGRVLVLERTGPARVLEPL